MPVREAEEKSRGALAGPSTINYGWGSEQNIGRKEHSQTQRQKKNVHIRSIPLYFTFLLRMMCQDQVLTGSWNLTRPELFSNNRPIPKIENDQAPGN